MSELTEVKPFSEQASAQLDAFVNNPGLEALASLYGAEELPNDRSEKLRALQAVATEHWDFRKGQERQEASWDDALLDEPDSPQSKTIFDASTQLGMVQNTTPVNKHPNSLVILGGANKAPLNRLTYGLGAVSTFDQVAYLGSSRPISDAERNNAKDYAPEAQTEFDLGCAAFEKIFETTVVAETRIPRDNEEWKMRIYQFKHAGEEKHGFALSTPSVIGVRRANTYDNFTFFGGSVELDKDPGHTAVAVTTGHFVPGQHLPGVQELTLNYGTQLETVGHNAEYDALNPDGSGIVRKPRQLLQEAKSAIDAAVRLKMALRQQTIA